MLGKRKGSAINPAGGQVLNDNQPSFWKNISGVSGFRSPKFQSLVGSTSGFFAKLDTWAPESHMWQDALQMAHSVQVLQLAGTCSALLEKATVDIPRECSLSGSTVSELAAAAFLTNLGYRVERLATDAGFEGQLRTPDFIIDDTIEFEVTRADPKAEHQSGVEYADKLCLGTFSWRLLWDSTPASAGPSSSACCARTWT